MAYIATIKLVINEFDERRVIDGLNDMMRNAQSEVDDDLEGENHWITDWAISQVDPAGDLIEKAIATGKYEDGYAFKDFVIFSPDEYGRDDGAGFWSNEYGWTTLDLATKYESPYGAPSVMKDDAVWMAAPYRMRFITMWVLEKDASQAILFECWADDFDHAVEQARDAYPDAEKISLYLP